MDARLERIIAANAAGVRDTELAKEFGISRQRIFQIRSEAGVGKVLVEPQRGWPHSKWKQPVPDFKRRNGLCMRGGCYEPVRIERQHCSKHLREMAATTRRIYAIQHPQRKREMVCVVCAGRYGPVREGLQTCQTCAERQSTSNARWEQKRKETH